MVRVVNEGFRTTRVRLSKGEVAFFDGEHDDYKFVKHVSPDASGQSIAHVITAYEKVFQRNSIDVPRMRRMMRRAREIVLQRETTPNGNGAKPRTIKRDPSRLSGQVKSLLRR